VDALSINAENVPTFTDDGYFNFVTHGDKDGAWVLENGEWTPVSHRTVANAIKASPEYTGGPVQLVACEAGACATGFARNLSNLLNVPVRAPTTKVMIYSSGQVEILGGGIWRDFAVGSPFHIW